MVLFVVGGSGERFLDGGVSGFVGDIEIKVYCSLFVFQGVLQSFLVVIRTGFRRDPGLLPGQTDVDPIKFPVMVDLVLTNLHDLSPLFLRGSQPGQFLVTGDRVVLTADRLCDVLDQIRIFPGASPFSQRIGPHWSSMPNRWMMNVVIQLDHHSPFSGCRDSIWSNGLGCTKFMGTIRLRILRTKDNDPRHNMLTENRRVLLKMKLCFD